METVTRVSRVDVNETRNGNRRFVVRGEDGGEYTTFRPTIGEQAVALEGRRARIQYHEEDRNNFHNVYLDAIEPVTDEHEHNGGDTDPAEAAWQTAVEAAPYLVGNKADGVGPDELFEKLKPFKD